MIFSDDGIVWTDTTTNPSNRCVACCYDSFRDRVVVIETGGACNVSSDCDTYTLNIDVTSIPTGNSANDSAIAYSAALDQLIFVSSNGLYSSEDGGVNWTQRDSNDFNDVAYSTVLNKWIVCNAALPRLKDSVDGITWVTRINPAGASGSWNGLALGDQI